MRRPWLWPHSIGRARSHAILVATVLWLTLIVTFLAGSGDRSIAGPIKGTDFLQFYTMGSLGRTGQTAGLYDFTEFHRAQVSVVPESAPELYPPVYPPHAALLFAPFSRLTFRHAMFLWSAITIAGFGVIIYSAWRSVAMQPRDAVFVIAAAAAFPPFWNLVLYGQATIVILAGFWLGWIALERKQRFLAGVAFGLLLFKPQFALPLVAVVLVCSEWSMLMGAAFSIAVQAGAVALLLGRNVLNAYGEFIPVIVRHADLLEPKPFESHSLRALTRLAPAAIGLPAWGILSVVVLAIAVAVWRTSAPIRVRLGTVILASVLVNPHLIIYDATVLALPLIWLGSYVQARGSQNDAERFWVCVYWLFVTLLAPTAAVIGIQVSVFLMIWILIVSARTVARPAGSVERSVEYESSYGIGLAAPTSIRA